MAFFAKTDPGTDLVRRSHVAHILHLDAVVGAVLVTLRWVSRAWKCWGDATCTSR